MPAARVVIGSAFGDEGKGLLTDFFASDNGPGSLVVRFNGGAQAGHTVVTPDGKRHVFSHFGSGTFANAKTLLSRYFIVHPIMFQRELTTLKGLGLSPDVMVDPLCLVTTPYDMLINQAAEEARGHARHGSVGVGIGETIERSLRSQYRILVADLFNRDRLIKVIEEIRTKWAFERIAALGFPRALESHLTILNSDIMRDRWIEDAQQFIDNIQMMDSVGVIGNAAKGVVFEGAQGLLLDEEHEWFPYVTRSKTGVLNAAKLAKEAGLDKLEVVYATRGYWTRHGAGPFPSETPDKPYPGVYDNTNVPHPFQGNLRYGHLDLGVFEKNVLKDVVVAQGILTALPTVAVTCVDQLPSDTPCSWNDNEGSKQGSRNQLIRAVANSIGAKRIIVSAGPTREDMLYNPNVNATLAGA